MLIFVFFQHQGPRAVSCNKSACQHPRTKHFPFFAVQTVIVSFKVLSDHLISLMNLVAGRLQGPIPASIVSDYMQNFTAQEPHISVGSRWKLKQRRQQLMFHIDSSAGLEIVIKYFFWLKNISLFTQFVCCYANKLTQKSYI